MKTNGYELIYKHILAFSFRVIIDSNVGVLIPVSNRESYFMLLKQDMSGGLMSSPAR